MNKLSNFFLTKKGIVLILFIFIVVGIIIRLSLVGRTDFWYDEAFTGTVLRENWQSMFNVLIEDKVHPPIYYVSLKLWATLFGYQDSVLRMFSVFWGIVLIPVTYLFGRMLDKDVAKGRLIGLLAAFFAAFSPYFFIYSVEARPYSLLMVFGALSAIAFYKSITTSPYKFNRYWLITIIILLASLLVHYLSIINLFFYILVYIIYRLYKRGTLNKPLFWKRLLLICIAGYASLMLLFTTDFVGKIVGQLKNRMGWIPSASLADPIKSVYAFLFGVDRQQTLVPPVLELSIPINPLNIAVILFIVIIASICIYIYKNRKNTDEVFLTVYLSLFTFVTLFTVALSSDFGIDMYVERYLSIYGWFLIVLVSFLAVKLWKKFTILFLAIYVLFIALLVYPTSNHMYQNTSAYIESELNHPARIYSCQTGTLVIMANYIEDYDTRLYLYAPKNYDLFSKSQLYNTTAGVVKDFEGAVTGDAYICPERRDDPSRTFLQDVDGIMIYKIN